MSKTCKMPALNWRFGAIGGVARPNFCGNFQVLWLVATFVKPPPAPSRPGVMCHFKDHPKTIVPTSRRHAEQLLWTLETYDKFVDESSVFDDRTKQRLKARSKFLR